MRAVLLAFASGVLVVGSPCTLPILPGFISSLAATGGDDDSGSAAWKPLRLTMAAMVFALGVGLALATTAAVGAWLMQGIAAWRPPLALIPGALLAIAGLATLEWAPLRRLRLGPQALPQPRSATPLLTGLALGVGWTPCATPALAVAMLAASHTESLGYAVALVVGHVLGVVAPLCAVVLGVTRIRVVRSALGRSGRAVQLTSGVLLVVQAVLVGTGLWERLAVQVMELTARL